MNITFDPFNAIERSFVESLLAGMSVSSSSDAGVAHSPPQTKPEVVDNPGTVVTGIAPSLPGDDGGEGEATALPASPAENPAPKKRGRKPVETSRDSEPVQSTDNYSLDDVRTALQSYTSVKGFAAGLDLLSSFNAKKISELEQEKYAAFISGCAV